MASSKLVEAIGYYKDAQDIYKESEVIIAQAKELVELTINSKENNNDDTTESINRKED
jgi:exonuclease VII small subunit